MQRITPDRSWPLFDTAASRAVESAAAANLPPHTLMQRAGLGVAKLALALVPRAQTIWVACGPGHALRFEPEHTGGLKPYLHVRRELWAKVTRALFYDLVELGEQREVAGEQMFGIVSGGEFFAMAPAESLREFA